MRLLFPEGVEKRDVYGRLLCHVILMDGRDFNLLLVEQGKSPYFNKYGNSRLKHEEFVAAQAEAKRRQLGVWNPMTNMPKTEGAPAAKRPYDRLLPWWQARADAIDAFRKQLTELVGRPETEWPRTNYSAVHYIFPNTTFTYTDSIDGETPVFTLFRLFPGREIGQTEVLFSTFKPRRSVPKDDAGFEALHDQLHQVVKNEDFATAANTWRSLRHAPRDMMLVFGRNEIILQTYHRELGERVGMPLGPE